MKHVINSRCVTYNFAVFLFLNPYSNFVLNFFKSITLTIIKIKQTINKTDLILNFKIIIIFHYVLL